MPPFDTRATVLAQDLITVIHNALRDWHAGDGDAIWRARVRISERIVEAFSEVQQDTIREFRGGD